MTQSISGYTNDEILATVTSLVQSTISRPIDALGVRRVDVSFNDIQQAASGVFLLYPNSPFYVVALGASRALDLVTAEELILVELLAAVQATGRKVLPVSDVSTLFNAQAALQELQGAAASRSASFADITALPAYQRFAANVGAFLGGPGQAVKANGQIVQTPQEAQAVIPGLVTQLQAAHTELVTTLTQLAAALDDFNSLNLPSIVASSVIGNAQSLIGRAATTLSPLTPTKRLTQVRQVVLDLLAAQGIVTTFGSFQKPSEFLTLSGTGFAFSDATHAGEPAEVTSDFGGAFGIITGTNDTLTTSLDGGGPSNITLAPAPLASLTSGLDESYFTFGDGTQPIQSPGGIQNNNVFKFRVAGTPFSIVFPPSPPPNAAVLTGTADVTNPGLYGGGGTLNGKTFTLVIDGVRTWSVTFSAPANSTALLSQINAVTHTGSEHDVIASFSGINLRLTSVNNGPTAEILIGAGNADTVLGFTNGQSIFGSNNPIAAAILAIAINGVAPAGVLADTVGAPAKLRIRCTSPSTQLAAETSLQVYGDDVPSKNCLVTLGFANGQLSTSHRSTADDVAVDITSKTSSYTAAAVFVPTAGLSGSAYSTAQNEVTIARIRTTGNTSFVGPVLTFTVGGVQVTGGVLPGDVIVLRDGPTLSTYNINTVNGVAPDGSTLQAGDVVVASGGAAGTNTPGVSADIGQVLPGTKYDSVDIQGGPNNGTYYVSGPGTTALDVLLISNLPVFIPNFQMTAAYGRMHVEFASKSRTTSSEISVNGNAAVLFFSSPPATAFGSSSWFKLPSMPRSIQAGDLLQYFQTTYNVSSLSIEIIGVEFANSLIQLDGTFPNGVNVNFAMNITVPFGRIRTGKLEDYKGFKADINTWLAGVVNSTTFFSDMNRKVNPLLVNNSPTAVQVNDAISILNQLYGVLSLTGARATARPANGTIESILSLYATQTQVVPQVDTLIKSFTEKGSDRAVDLLLSGQFSAFFSLSMDDASYAGAFQAATRAVAMNDLPVRKFNRSDAVTARLLGQTQSPDYEFPANGTTEQFQGEQVSPPSDYGTPNNFGTTTGSEGAGGS